MIGVGNFILGQVAVTRTINDLLITDSKFNLEYMSAFIRYCQMDWGDMCMADKRMNDDAVRNGNDRIFAAYNTSRGKIYIITECDRSATTVLFEKED